MIERLYMHNFRCMENFTLKLAGQTSVLLIGRNGSGKSTVRRSLEIFQSICRGTNRVSNLISINDFTQKRTDRPMRLEADINLEGKRYTYRVAFEWPPEFREARIAEEALLAEGKILFIRRQSEVELAGGISFNIDWHVFALTVIIVELPGSRSIQDVKAFFAGMVIVSPAPADMHGYSDEPSTQLKVDAVNFASCLRALLEQKPAAYSVFDSHVKEVIPDFSSIENVPRGESGMQLIVKFEQQDPRRSLSVEFRSLSDGEKCFFLSAYLTAFNSFGPPLFCMWDEPDNHLSLSEVGQFVTRLRKAAKRGGQFIATTHHPETLRRFTDETTIVLTRKSHLDPVDAKPLSETPYVGDLVDALVRDEIIGVS